MLFLVASYYIYVVKSVMRQAYQEMAYCSRSTSHVKQQTIAFLFFVALRDFGGSDAKKVATNWKIFGECKSLSKKLI